jgi:ketosteroid isomerase-like protein
MPQSYRHCCLVVFAATVSSLIAIMPTQAIAAPDQPAPRELVNAVEAIDQAGNKQDVDGVLRFYADGFSHSDGLTRETLKTSLRDLWQRYSKISYKTEIKNWELKGNQYFFEAITNVQGNQKEAKFKPFSLSAELSSKQVLQQKDGKWQILRQDILQESSLLTAGDKPPKVEMRLPNVIGLGRQYSLDAIAETPDFNIMLGAIFEEPVTATGFFKDKTINLEPLRGGGIYKIGQAPYKEGNYWISVVMVREGGIAISGQRLRVSKDEVGEQYKPLPDIGVVRSRIRPSIPRQPAS